MSFPPKIYLAKLSWWGAEKIAGERSFTNTNSGGEPRRKGGPQVPTPRET